MARIKRYNSDTGQWEYCNTGGMPIKGIDYLTRADYDTMRADIDAYLERNKESVGVTVSGNQTEEDIIGASVSIVGEDGSVIGEKVWNGSELVFRMEAGTVYHVEVDASGQGFSGYVSETFTAVKGGTRTLVAEVYAEKVNVGVEGIDSGFTVTVKEEYTACEYIESTGAQYIDTGIKANNNTRVVIDFEMTATPGATSVIFGGRDSSSAAMFEFMWHANGYFRSDYNKTATQQWAVEAVGRRTVDKDKETTTVDGVSNSYTNATFSGSYNLHLFSLNDGGTTLKYPSSYRLYSCKIYDNGVLVRDYIPVMNGSGVYGLYDKVDGVFYASATTTGFTGAVAQGKTFLTLAETSGSCLVPYGTVYSVSATAVDGYDTPSSQTFTANVDSRSVVMTYEENLLGVFIEDINGKLWTESEWDGSVEPNGVAVCTENCRFVLALEDAYYSTCMWGSYGTLITGITSVNSSVEAVLDFNGKSNTSAICEQDSNATASIKATEYTFPNGQNGYLGAAGEWQAVLDNSDIVAEAIYKCNGTAFSGTHYWTSTQMDDSYAWAANKEGKYISGTYKDSMYYSRAFTTLKRDTN